MHWHKRVQSHIVWRLPMRRGRWSFRMRRQRRRRLRVRRRLRLLRRLVCYLRCCPFRVPVSNVCNNKPNEMHNLQIVHIQYNTWRARQNVDNMNPFILKICKSWESLFLFLFSLFEIANATFMWFLRYFIDVFCPLVSLFSCAILAVLCICFLVV